MFLANILKLPAYSRPGRGDMNIKHDSAIQAHQVLKVDSLFFAENFIHAA